MRFRVKIFVFAFLTHLKIRTKLSKIFESSLNVRMKPRKLKRVGIFVLGFGLVFTTAAQSTWAQLKVGLWVDCRRKVSYHWTKRTYLKDTTCTLWPKNRRCRQRVLGLALGLGLFLNQEYEQRDRLWALELSLLFDFTSFNVFTDSQFPLEML